MQRGSVSGGTGTGAAVRVGDARCGNEARSMNWLEVATVRRCRDWGEASLHDVAREAYIYTTTSRAHAGVHAMLPWVAPTAVVGSSFTREAAL
eukprot:2443788-Prymnesium_polylepis.2